MPFANLTITPFSKGGDDKKPELLIKKAITVLFNPNAYTITKTVKWTPPQSNTTGEASAQRLVDAPTLTFGGGESRQLTLELFFDITEPTAGQTDVRQETDKIVKLTRINPELGRPPTIQVTWGGNAHADFPFVGVISNLTQRFTLFKSTGEALRATLNVTIVEFIDIDIELRKTDPELTTRLVKRGDSLSNIAAEFYSDPALWRVIAEANGLDNPLRLDPGRRLTIPQL
jgi:nucleoid-associated protein YgaU